MLLLITTQRPGLWVTGLEVIDSNNSTTESKVLDCRTHHEFSMLVLSVVEVLKEHCST